MKKLALFVGTRPEVIKMAPVCRALLANKTPYHLFAVGQQPHLLKSHLEEMGLIPTLYLDIPRDEPDLNYLLGNEILRLRQIMWEMYSVAIVHGDTTTTLAASLAAFHHKVPVAHVEAGLRTSHISLPFPEEANRRLVSELATYHFAPTAQAAVNLEGRPHVYVTGQTGIDSFRYALMQPEPPSITALLAQCKDHQTALVTCHRRENWGHVQQLAKQLIALAPANIKIIWPLHPNPQINVAARVHLAGQPHVILTDPLSYTEMTHLINAVTLVVTDSGGIIEEATDAEKPLIVLRHETERPECMDGAVRLIPLDQPGLAAAVVELAAMNRTSHGRFGHGAAGAHVAQILAGIPLAVGTPAGGFPAVFAKAPR